MKPHHWWLEFIPWKVSHYLHPYSLCGILLPLFPPPLLLLLLLLPLLIFLQLLLGYSLHFGFQWFDYEKPLHILFSVFIHLWDSGIMKLKIIHLGAPTVAQCVKNLTATAWVTAEVWVNLQPSAVGQRIQYCHSWSKG